MRLALVVLALLLAGPAAAEVYRWVDAHGTVHYSDAAPPQGVQAKVLEIDARAGPDSPDTKECYTVRCQGERLEERLARRDAAEAKEAAQRAAAAPKPPRGLEFRKYISIQRGMSAGELLGIAGEPDLIFDQGLAISAPTTVQTGRYTRGAARAAMPMSSYTYLPTSADPFTTTITLVGGRVSEIERIRKF